MPESHHDSQDKILYQIKRLGPQSAKSLAEQLGITTMGTRQHLARLEAEGLVYTGEPVAQPRGRPVALWHLSEAGQRRFPDAHAQVTLELISGVRDLLGEAALDRVIADRGQQTLTHYLEALEDQDTLGDRVAGLARLRDAEGYMATAESLDDGSFLLIENHCPICIAAESCQGFCRAELDCFREVFGNLATVEREDYLLDGARRCSYRITPHR